METSPKFSFKGYSLTEWFDRNKDKLKNLLLGVSALATFISTTSVPRWLQIVLTMIVPSLIALGIDAIDFYSSKVKL